ncbi:hypothetical protein QJQ45_022323 [Haematococcus lacustris]|nr:hypothetical protein QJQ45_022323 [Haematococcus lacustris]
MGTIYLTQFRNSRAAPMSDRDSPPRVKDDDEPVGRGGGHLAQSGAPGHDPGHDLEIDIHPGGLAHRPHGDEAGLSRSRSPGGRAFYGLPNRREPPRVGLQMFVAGFNFLSTERDVERRFGRYGNVTEVRIVRDPTGKSRGFGFVAMDNEEDVREAFLLWQLLQLDSGDTAACQQQVEHVLGARVQQADTAPPLRPHASAAALSSIVDASSPCGATPEQPISTLLCHGLLLLDLAQSFSRMLAAQASVLTPGRQPQPPAQLRPPPSSLSPDCLLLHAQELRGLGCADLQLSLLPAPAKFGPGCRALQLDNVLCLGLACQQEGHLLALCRFYCLDLLSETMRQPAAATAWLQSPAAVKLLLDADRAMLLDQVAQASAAAGTQPPPPAAAPPTASANSRSPGPDADSSRSSVGGERGGSKTQCGALQHFLGRQEELCTMTGQGEEEGGEQQEALSPALRGLSPQTRLRDAGDQQQHPGTPSQSPEYAEGPPAVRKEQESRAVSCPLRDAPGSRVTGALQDLGSGDAGYNARQLAASLALALLLYAMYSERQALRRWTGRTLRGPRAALGAVSAAAGDVARMALSLTPNPAVEQRRQGPNIPSPAMCTEAVQAFTGKPGKGAPSLGSREVAIIASVSVVVCCLVVALLAALAAH